MKSDRFNEVNYRESDEDEITTAKLAVLGGLLSTLGDAISTIAAILSLQESNNENNNKIIELERQMNDLTNLIKSTRKERII